MERLLPRYTHDGHLPELAWNISPTSWLQLPARLSPREEPGKAFIIDFSLEGALVETDFSKHAVGDLVPIKLGDVEGRVRIAHIREEETKILYGITWEEPEELFQLVYTAVGEARQL
jgi:hypothetical protein